jgi:hypothetical protein
MRLDQGNRPLLALPSDTRYELWVLDGRGYRTRLLTDYVSLGFSLSTKDTAGMTLEVPWDYAALIPDYSIVELWRKVGERAPSFVECFILVSRPQGLGSKGTPFLSLSGPTLTGYVLSDKRIVQAVSLPSGAAVSVSALSARTGPMDDVAKQYLSDGLTAWDSSSGERAWLTQLRLTVAANRGQLPRERITASLTPMRSVLTDIQSRAEQSTKGARRLYYRVRPASFDPLTLRFETLTTRYGADRGFDAALPMVLSQANGTLGQVEVEDDRTSEVNSVLVKYVSGGATKLTRITDTRRARLSPYAFREAFYSATATTKTGVEAEARYRLSQGKPRRMVRATATPSALVRPLIDYHLGDVVIVEALGRQWEAELVAVSTGQGSPVQLRLDEWSDLT